MGFRQAIAAVALVLSLVACQTPAAPVTAWHDAPTPAALRGGNFELDSAALGRPLHIHVALPEGYATQERAYPTIYFTDGDSLFPLPAPTHLFLTYDEPIPPAIVVGIAYGSFDPAAGNLRHVDFSVPQPDAPEGGAAAYQRFLAEELIPELDHWNGQGERPWTLRTATIDNGAHAASIGEVYRQGLLWLFRDELPGN